MPPISKIPVAPAPPAPDPSVQTEETPPVDQPAPDQFYEGWHSALLHMGVISQAQYNEVLDSDQAFAIDPPGALIAKKIRADLNMLIAPEGGQ